MNVGSLDMFAGWEVNFKEDVLLTDNIIHNIEVAHNYRLVELRPHRFVRGNLEVDAVAIFETRTGKKRFIGFELKRLTSPQNLHKAIHQALVRREYFHLFYIVFDRTASEVLMLLTPEEFAQLKQKKIGLITLENILIPSQYTPTKVPVRENLERPKILIDWHIRSKGISPKMLENLHQICKKANVHLRGVFDGTPTIASIWPDSHIEDFNVARMLCDELKRLGDACKERDPDTHEYLAVYFLFNDEDAAKEFRNILVKSIDASEGDVNQPKFSKWLGGYYVEIYYAQRYPELWEIVEFLEAVVFSPMEDESWRYWKRGKAD